MTTLSSRVLLGEPGGTSDGMPSHNPFPSCTASTASLTRSASRVWSSWVWACLARGQSSLPASQRGLVRTSCRPPRACILLGMPGKEVTGGHRSTPSAVCAPSLPPLPWWVCLDCGQSFRPASRCGLVRARHRLHWPDPPSACPSFHGVWTVRHSYQAALAVTMASSAVGSSAAMTLEGRMGEVHRT